MKLKVGMYARVKEIDGVKIVKILKIIDDGFKADNNMFYIVSEVIKASHNIIDLIEVGDYVNGVEVEEITDNEIMLVDTHLYIDKSVANDLIETILTHEQFENNCYKIGGE